MFSKLSQRSWTQWQAAVTLHCKLSWEQKWTKSDGQLAALGVRLMLEFEPLRKSADQEAKLVELEGHMRVVYSVPEHRRNQTERALQVNESSIFPLELESSQ